MPRPNSFGYSGITWREVGEVWNDVESEAHCQLELHIVRAAPTRNSSFQLWVVSAVAVRYKGRPDQTVGVGGCPVGGNRGASSMQGAALNAIYEARDDLLRRLADKRYDRDHPPERLPGF